MDAELARVAVARKPVGDAIKRAFDVVVGGLVLLLLSPVLGVVALIIKRDGGPAIYKGTRAGIGGKPFGMMKFRSMVVNADKLGPPSTADDDPRITRIGKMLRRYKLDELPQLINVLRGEMSLVGPRPEVTSEVETYDATERGVLAVRPGMTDYASIKFRNEGEILAGSADPHEAYRKLIRPGKLALGLYYVEHRSLWRDLKIIALTVASIVRHEWAERRLPQP